MNEELLVSLLEPTSWCEHSSPERADYQTEPLIGYVKKFILMILVSKRLLRHTATKMKELTCYVERQL
jgi:hypothetical protein